MWLSVLLCSVGFVWALRGCGIVERERASYRYSARTGRIFEQEPTKGSWQDPTHHEDVIHLEADPELEKWIFSYRREGRRVLSVDESSAYLVQSKKMTLRSVGFGFGLVPTTFALSWLMPFTETHWLYFVPCLLCGFGLLFCVASSLDAYRLGNLFRYVFTLGTVDRYVADVVPDTEGQPGSWKYYTFYETRKQDFDESLKVVTGSLPDWFETASGQLAVVTVEDTYVRTMIEGDSMYYKRDVETISE